MKTIESFRITNDFYYFNSFNKKMIKILTNTSPFEIYKNNDCIAKFDSMDKAFIYWYDLKDKINII